jgi:V8-like Glu-specific endopeptidase
LIQLTEDACGKIEIFDENLEVNQQPHWPWMASYGFLNKENQWQHRCGATLITELHFITAAHCLEEGEKEG